MRAVYEGQNVLVHRTRGYRLAFTRAIQEHQIKVLAGIRFFDAWRLRPCLAELSELKPSVERVPGQGPDGSDDAVTDANINDDLTSVESLTLSSRSRTMSATLKMSRPGVQPSPVLTKNPMRTISQLIQLQLRRLQLWWSRSVRVLDSSTPLAILGHFRTCGYRRNSLYFSNRSWTNGHGSWLRSLRQCGSDVMLLKLNPQCEQSAPGI